ncbi:MAG TPA: SDR family oxidoreductase [Gammaproteobacteria bacterium]|nr:SDR family oxidoreductase [Gammaproteobacteria bacterium]
MSTLAGKTIVITGGSRGIGQAIGERCKKAGATIFTDIDVTDANTIKSSVEKAVKQYGGIDILVNNISTFCFTDTLNTPQDKFDLLFSSNVRATFLMSQACLPYLQKTSNPHIITLSPPLDMNAKWFKSHLVFTMSKYGMSMCTLGMAAEFREAGVAVNSLWPLTTIATSTIQDHCAPEVYAASRWPTIMADAAYEIMQKNARECTGNFFIDEELLRESGVTDFTHYAVDAKVPLMQDLFIPEKSIKGESAELTWRKL